LEVEERTNVSYSAFLKFFFGDHTKDSETRAILTHALQHVDTFKHFVPTLHPSPSPHLLAAHLTPEIQAYSDFISKSLKTVDRNKELMIGIVKHLLHENNITLVIHRAPPSHRPETVNSKSDYSYQHTDHPMGNRVRARTGTT
jgi:hypothetical protein